MMPILLTLISIECVSVDDDRFPDLDTAHVPDHLRRYCAKLEVLPAITIRVEGELAILVRGHKYLAVAKALGRERIRAVVEPASSREDVERFLARADVEVLDWEQIKVMEARETALMAWHVVYFQRALSAEQKAAFENLLMRLTRSNSRILSVHHGDSGPFVEFQIETRVADHEWVNGFLHCLSDFSGHHVPIVSYQGRRHRFR